jgi:hypothetical protein
MSAISKFFGLAPAERTPPSKRSEAIAALIWFSLGLIASILTQERARSIVCIVVGFVFATYSVADSILRNSPWRFAARFVLSVMMCAVVYWGWSPR